MDVDKKYALLMQDYLLETLLEQDQHELYLYTLTVLHTGLRARDMLDLTWEQFDGDKFKDVKLHKISASIEKEVREDILIRNPQEYTNALNKIDIKSSGKMFTVKQKYGFTYLLKKYTGVPSIYSTDLRIYWSRLL